MHAGVHRIRANLHRAALAGILCWRQHTFGIAKCEGETGQMTAKRIRAAVTAVVFHLGSVGGAPAYEPGDVLVQLLAAGFYSDASGHVGPPGIDYKSGSVTANPALDLTYFFTKNIAAHTVIAVPLAKVDLKIGSQTVNVTDQWALPMSIMGQYHFLSDSIVSPYIGGGLTYAKFWEHKSHLGSHVEVDDTYGGGVNIGINVKIPDTRWVAAVDVKKLWLAPANVHLGGNKVNNVSVDPWWFGLGIGCNFSTPALL
jgi:outer membrane protein